MYGFKFANLGRVDWSSSYVKLNQWRYHVCCMAGSKRCQYLSRQTHILFTFFNLFSPVNFPKGCLKRSRSRVCLERTLWHLGDPLSSYLGLIRPQASTATCHLPPHWPSKLAWLCLPSIPRLKVTIEPRTQTFPLCHLKKGFVSNDCELKCICQSQIVKAFFSHFFLVTFPQYCFLMFQTEITNINKL